MIRYFCNSCEKELSAKRFTAAVKDADGKQENLHYCADCMKYILPVMRGKYSIDLIKKLSSLQKEEKDKAAAMAALANASSKVTNNQDIVDANLRYLDDPKDEKEEDKVSEPEVKKPTKPVAKAVAKLPDEPVGTPIERKEPDEKLYPKEDKEGDDKIVDSVMAAVEELDKLLDKQAETTGNNESAEATYENDAYSEPQRRKGDSRVQLKEELPTPPRKSANVTKIRRILIDFYMGVSPKTTQARVNTDVANYYYTLSRYGSKQIADRYKDMKVKWTDEKGQTIKCSEVLSLYAGGFSLEQLAESEFDTDVLFIEKILRYFTGL